MKKNKNCPLLIRDPASWQSADNEQINYVQQDIAEKLDACEIVTLIACPIRRPMS